MAQFRATIQGNRGEASRLGTKNSGLDADVNGWNVGCRVAMTHESGVDVIRIYRTSGSNASETSRLIAEYREGQPTFFYGDKADAA